MEEKFLENRDHGIYINKSLTYKKYMCKDCNQKKKEYECCDKDDDREPKEINNLGYIEVSIGYKYPIYITTPTMVCPFGFNKDSNTITLQFTNIKTDSSMKSFYDLIQNFELSQMEYIGLEEEEIDLYLSQIRHDKNMKYDPNLIVKIPFKGNSYDVDIRNKDSPCSITNVYKWTKMKCDIYIDKIWKFNGKYVCKWKVKKILIV